MRQILAMISQFLEAHIEKLVMAVVGVISLAVLLLWVVSSPNAVSFDGRTLRPGDIDSYLDRQYTEVVRQGLGRSPQARVKHGLPMEGALDVNDAIREGIRGPFNKGAAGLFDCPIDYIDAGLYPPIPGGNSSGTTGIASATADDRQGIYHLPLVGEVIDVDMEYLRVAAYVPLVPLDELTTYEQAPHDVNDIDLVTVSAKFNVSALYERFHDAFAGYEVPTQARDPKMAKPIFGAVDLQRQTRLVDGQWGDWQSVPRIAIENRRELFHVTEKASQLPSGGIQVLALKLDRTDVAADLLQPKCYQIASAYEEWFPPVLHRKYLAIVDKQKKQEKRDAREAERAAQQSTDTRGGARGKTSMANPYMVDPQGRANPRTRTPGQRPGTRGDPALDPMAQEMLGTPMQELPAMDQVLADFVPLQITFQTDLSKLDELLFWAHDDTIEPGKAYRYRIRLGVLNPIAGTSQVNQANASQEDQAVLWSEFSDITSEIAIPARKYFFAKDCQEATGMVNVEVATFVLGYWRAENFQVKPGELIGRVVETEKPKPLTAGPGGMPIDPYAMMANPTPEATVTPPQIDYGTGVVLLGVQRVDGWAAGMSMRPQVYQEMLYSRDNGSIEHMPVGIGNWAGDMKTNYEAVIRAKQIPLEAFRTFGATRRTAEGMTPDGLAGYPPY